MIKKIIKKIIIIINKINIRRQKITIGENPIINGLVFFRNYGSIIIGKNFKATSGKNNNPIGGDTVLRLICRKDAQIKIGDNVGISNATLHICKKLTIKDNVLIGGGCKIWDSDFHSIDYRDRIFDGDNNIKIESIYISENVFIGANSIILKGVKIGKNSVIGAGSVVTKNVPENEIWAGNPAKKIKGLES